MPESTHKKAEPPDGKRHTAERQGPHQRSPTLPRAQPRSDLQNQGTGGMNTGKCEAVRPFRAAGSPHTTGADLSLPGHGLGFLVAPFGRDTRPPRYTPLPILHANPVLAQSLIRVWSLGPFRARFRLCAKEETGSLTEMRGAMSSELVPRRGRPYVGKHRLADRRVICQPTLGFAMQSASQPKPNPRCRKRPLVGSRQ